MATPRKPGVSRTGPGPKPIEERNRTQTGHHRPIVAPLAIIPGGGENPKVPEPKRPLGQPGQELWERVWKAGATWLSPRIDVELLLILCEQMDERAALRARVFRDNHWRDRAGLRALDLQVMSGLAMLGFTPVDRARMGYANAAAQRERADDFFGRRSARGS